MRCSPPGSSSSPHGKGCPPARRAPRTPTRPRSAAACPPTRSRPGRRSSVTCTTGWSARSPRSDWGPSGWRQSAPSTCRHHGACATARVGGKSSGSRPANTNDQPKRSASVTWPVASTKRSNSAFVTAHASIQNGSTPHAPHRSLAVARDTPSGPRCPSGTRRRRAAPCRHRRHRSWRSSLLSPCLRQSACASPTASSARSRSARTSSGGDRARGARAAAAPVPAPHRLLAGADGRLAVPGGAERARGGRVLGRPRPAGAVVVRGDGGAAGRVAGQPVGAAAARDPRAAVASGDRVAARGQRAREGRARRRRHGRGAPVQDARAGGRRTGSARSPA